MFATRHSYLVGLRSQRRPRRLDTASFDEENTKESPFGPRELREGILS